MTTWRIELSDIDGPVVVSDLAVRSFSYSDRLNAAGTFEAVLSGANTQATLANIKPGAREIRVYRDGTAVWGGYLWSVNVNSLNKKHFNVTLRGEGWLSRLRYRYVMKDLHYRDVNQETIAWKLIHHTQTLTKGDLGFSQGSHTGSSVPRERHYCSWERDSIAGAISELSNQDDGFDMEITPAGEFKTYSPKKGSASGITIDGGDAFPFDYEYDASDMANFITGLGNDDCNPVVYDLVDAGKRAEFGLLQSVLDNDTNKEKDVRSHTQTYLDLSKNVRYRGSFTYLHDKMPGGASPAYGTLTPGDTFTLTSGTPTAMGSPLGWWRMDEPDPIFTSPTPSEVTWSQSSGMTINSSTQITRTGGTPASWSEHAYSNEGYVASSGVGLKFKVATLASSEFMVGLCYNPAVSASWEGLNLAFYFTGSVLSAIYADGAALMTSIGHTVVDTDEFAIVYSGSWFRCYVNDVEIYRVSSTFAAQPLYFDTSFATIGVSVNDIVFGPVSPAYILNDSGSSNTDIPLTYAAPTYQTPGVEATGVGMTMVGETQFQASSEVFAGLFSGPGSVMGWVKSSDFGSSYCGLIGTQNGGFWLGLNNNVPHIFSWSSGGQSGTAVDISDDQWHHLALTFSGAGTGKLYVDGVIKYDSTYVVITPSDTSTNWLAVGGHAWASQRMNGSMDEVALYNTQLSDSAIAAIADGVGEGGSFGNFTTTARVIEHEVIGQPPTYIGHRISFDSGA